MSAELDVGQIDLRAVDGDNWRDVMGIGVTDEQRQFVAEPSYYLALCAYGGIWKPLAICLDNAIIGFMMWAYDSDDESCWLGGFLIDQTHQRRGFGRRALGCAIDALAEDHGFAHFALSYQPENTQAKALYMSFGFTETGEMAENEVVARYKFNT